MGWGGLSSGRGRRVQSDRGVQIRQGYRCRWLELEAHHPHGLLQQCHLVPEETVNRHVEGLSLASAPEHRQRLEVVRMTTSTRPLERKKIEALDPVAEDVDNSKPLVLPIEKR